MKQTSTAGYSPAEKPEGPNLKLKQLQYESESWKRLLSFVQEENIHLKNQLSEILKDSFDNGFLDEAENFQTRFVHQDEYIAALRVSVGDFDRLVAREAFTDGVAAREISQSLKRLRHRTKEAARVSDQITEDFNHFLEAL